MSAVQSYLDARTRAINVHALDLTKARETAYEWHGGGSSPLYSFASCNCTIHSNAHREKLRTEIRKCIFTVLGNPTHYKDGVELLKIRNLLKTVMTLPAKDEAA